MQKDENTKEKILKIAIKLFAQKGFGGVSVREICKEADVNLCLISYYFGGKQELYNTIIDNLIEKLTQYAKTFLNFSVEPRTLSKKEQINLLFIIFDKFIDFYYSNISSDMILILLREQQNPNWSFKLPVFAYLRKLIATVFDLEEEGRENTYQTLFIISQVNSPKIFPAFSYRLLGQKDFCKEDIDLIRNNIKFYVNLLLKEKNIV